MVKLKLLAQIFPGSLLALGLSSACLTAPEPQAPRPGTATSEHVNFEAIDWLSEWRPKPKGRFGLDNLSVHTEDSPVERYLRAEYYQGGASPSASRRVGVKEGGGQFMGTLHGGPVDRLFLRYFVRFADDFEFVKGGKLPGLYGGTRVSGGRIPDGTDGFSTRFMWRTGGMGEAYVYMPSSKQWGSSLGRGSFMFKRGEWQCLEQELILNTPGQPNGVLRTWSDGVLAYENENLLFRTVPYLKIEGVFFSTFFGGGDPSWAPPQDTHADFARFATGPSRIGCELSHAP